jgi:hypothetical protein
MKLFKFDNGEQDWIAAETQEQAAEIYQNEYGLRDCEMAEVSISEVADPTAVEVYPDGWDYEDEEAEPPTAAEFMTKPGIVCTTCQ